ncbi:undecaprenyldiphospho-muramoylpentapeptide beta-N-acetylglucosaminyltransferase [Fumia xinanensis]|uniref:UDP-N-acetylglucosamine--N-acetylmuramyl-(pentapeptide) pyrophosphoryl-undecaprenol N-acetylglucosamine transferase n=1 Tax=Fumia xinanensis TaxID=2763659 RepID=A0A926I7K9_9FIRM|nr:undecaprenyldiphospho-muramoylpentapeptide beta-N-acetylglucosaminyltransferase [Fumia xinanensis]MBC8559967.1 undecaprenyldiphospho-muramoylpentapeptide beta-N-acetylglucosaminyltransferase [Fumia xinanensis]PWL47881.1 MAG: undecaprenyldiphospho-muramoylpentapeptide beta-N-acetylglucosaminyltransferase [Clostridiales bacterium]
MKILLAGGGTAGHINPAISIANEIKARRPDTEFLFAAAPGGMEDTLVPKAGYPVAHIHVAGFRRSFSPADIAHNLKAVSYLATAGVKARKILNDFQPDAVIGTGGYLSGPVLLAAQKKKIPTFLHEANAFPGVTIKALSKRATVIMLAFPEAQQYLPAGKRYEVVGIPVRQSFVTTTKREAREKLGLDDNFTILSFGGSQGALKINEIAADIMQWHCKDGKINHIHGYGKHGRDTFPKMLKERHIDLSKYPRIQAKEYIDNMNLYVAAADIVISRAGASTIMELEVAGKPSILVPYPYAAENHQYHNARVLSDADASILVEEKDYDRVKLLQEIRELYEHPERLSELSQNASKLAVLDTTEKIYNIIMTELEKK